MSWGGSGRARRRIRRCRRQGVGGGMGGSRSCGSRRHIRCRICFGGSPAIRRGMSRRIRRGAGSGIGGGAGCSIRRRIRGSRGRGKSIRGRRGGTLRRISVIGRREQILRASVVVLGYFPDHHSADTTGSQSVNGFVGSGGHAFISDKVRARQVIGLGRGIPLNRIAHGVEPGFHQGAIALIPHRTIAPAAFPEGVDGGKFIRVKRHARVNFGGRDALRNQIPVEGGFETTRLLGIGGILKFRSQVPAVGIPTAVKVVVHHIEEIHDAFERVEVHIVSAIPCVVAHGACRHGKKPGGGHHGADRLHHEGEIAFIRRIEREFVVNIHAVIAIGLAEVQKIIGEIGPGRGAGRNRLKGRRLTAAAAAHRHHDLHPRRMGPRDEGRLQKRRIHRKRSVIGGRIQSNEGMLDMGDLRHGNVGRTIFGLIPIGVIGDDAFGALGRDRSGCQKNQSDKPNKTLNLFELRAGWLKASHSFFDH